MPGPAVDHGPMLIGIVLNTLLFGIMITQVYIYYTSYSRDKPFMKLLVLGVFSIDTFNSTVEIIYIYLCLILHFGDIDYLKTANWESTIGPALTGVNSLMVQLFFAWRIRVLTRNWFLVATVVMLALSSATCAFVTTWEVIVTLEFARFQDFKSVVIFWLACAAAADITITTILVWHLHKTGFKGSDMVIDRIIRLTVQTGLITSVVATVDLTLYLASSSSLHLLFNWALCQLYSNTLMGSLNARGRWRSDTSTWGNVLFSEGHERSDKNDNSRKGWQANNVTSSRRPSSKNQSILDPTRTGVFIHVESHELRDMESHGKDLQAEENGCHFHSNKGREFLSLSDTCDRKELAPV